MIYKYTFHLSRLLVHVHVVKCKTWQNWWTVGESNFISKKVFWSVNKKVIVKFWFLLIRVKKCLLLRVLVLLILHSTFRSTLLLLILHSIFRSILLWSQEIVVPSRQDHFLPPEYGRKIIARQPLVSNRYVSQRATFFLFVMWTGIYFSLNPQVFRIPFLKFCHDFVRALSKC